MLKKSGYVFIILVSLTVLTIDASQHAIAQQNDRNCPTGYACFKQGDYLKYYEANDGKPFLILNYTCFLESGCNGTPSPDANPVQFAQPMMIGNWEYSLTNICNWSDEAKKCINPTQSIIEVYPNTGIINNENILEPVPIDVNHWIDDKFSVSDGVYNYKGMNRQITIATQGASGTPDNHGHMDMDKYLIDKETGITLYHEGYSFGEWYNDTLIDTNIMHSSSISAQQPTQTTKQNITQTSSQSNQVKSQIPSWVKNNAHYWSIGNIGDDDFVKGIQYLIQQKIITIPTTTQGTGSQTTIPNWIKKDAGWWSEGEMSDDDFIKAIQYLISNGIITP